MLAAHDVFRAFLRSTRVLMPADSDDEHLNRVVHRVTEHVQIIDDAVAEDRPSKAWHELDRLKTYLDHELSNAD